MEAQARIALRAARQVTPLILNAMDRLDEVDVTQKAVNDFVSNVDRESERIIADALHQAFPDHGVRGEEGGQIYPEGETNWVIDPLDGTLNFVRGIPHYCISIAAMKGRRVEHGVILDPVRNEEFVASRGKGAQLNGKRIRVTTPTRLDDSVIGTGIPPHSINRHNAAYMAMLEDFTAQCVGVRRLGSAALDLAYVAAGRFDGMFEMGLSLWDVAAGVLLVNEAGGFTGDFAGGDTHLTSGNIVAANQRLFKTMIQTIKPHMTPEIHATQRAGR